jgi:hypothetical protein
MKRALWSIFVAVILVNACGQQDRPAVEDNASEATIPFRDDGNLTFLRGSEEVVTIDVEIADTDSARVRGLMQRTSLPEQSGMLFVFERAETQGFHMSNTPIALDLIFADAELHIVDVDKYNQPFDQSIIGSDAAAQYVIEVPAGFADTYGIIEGERVQWTRDPQDSGGALQPE